MNAQGQVVGLNTWGLVGGQNMNFAISVEHIQTMLASSQSGAHPLAELPSPREPVVALGKGDRSLEYWEEVSRISRSLADRIGKIRPVPIPTSKAKMKSVFPKLAGVYKRVGNLLPEAAEKLKALNIDGVDPELVGLVTVDALNLETIGENARQTALAISLMQVKSVSLFDPEKLRKKAYGEFDDLEVGQSYDVMRIKLTKRYGLTFHSLFDARPSGKSSADKEEKED